MFNKGESGNPLGRPKGSKNKLTKAIELCEELGLRPMEEAIRGIQKLDEGPEKIALWLKVSDFVYAKPRDKQEIQLEASTGLVIIRTELPKPIEPRTIVPIEGLLDK